MKLYYKIDTLDKNGKIIHKGKKRKSRSFVIGFANLLSVQIANRRIAMINTGNISITVMPHTNNLRLLVAMGDHSNGIVVGTGTTMVSTSDIRLVSVIPHGSAAGQLHYAATMCSDVSVTPTRTHFTISRNLTNQTTANITINEVGLIIIGSETTVAAAHNFLAIRDVISPPITFTPGQTRSISYEFSFDL